MDFNAVVKGIPINATQPPVPYYLPDDFAMIHLKFKLLMLTFSREILLLLVQVKFIL